MRIGARYIKRSLQLILALVAYVPTVGADTQPPVRNLILLIGDGMGPQQLALGALYARHGTGDRIEDGMLHLERMMQQGETGLVMIAPENGLVADSACAASQFATGELCLSETLGLNSAGDPVPTILELAEKAGKSTGLVSDTRITHATPAAFAAHVSHRSMENEIAEQLLDSGVDVLLGGGTRHWFPQAVNDASSSTYREARELTGNAALVVSRRKDDKNLLSRAAERGYALAFDRSQLLRKLTGDKLLGLFAVSGLPDGIEHSRSKDDASRVTPTLPEMTQRALDVLEGNPNGFFLMVEAGQIDWAGHNNDAGRMLHEMLRFDEVVKTVLQWTKQRNDTLVVVTADHESGSFGFSYSAKDVPAPRAISGSAFEGRSFAPRYNFIDPGVLDRLYAQKKSLNALIHEFDQQSWFFRGARSLVELVNDNSAFSISIDDARDVLAVEHNDYLIDGHPQLGHSIVPRIRDFKAFYPYIVNNRAVLLGRKLAPAQGVIWGTGTHTTTPVPVIADGPVALEEQFDGMYNGDHLGRLLRRALGLSAVGSAN